MGFEMTEAWAYYNANTIEIIGDVSAYYWPNQLVSITQTMQKFFVVMGVAVIGGNTHLTVSGGDIYALANAPITAHAVTANAGISGLPSGFIEQGLAYGAASKDTPADGDRISLWDSAANFVQKALTWANLKAALKAYFDTLYAASGKGVTNGDSHDHVGGDGSQIDHGGLGGLTDDDHSQYLTTIRHDTTTRHGPSVVDHGSIGGLGDDDHSQYLLLAGRSGGLQTITGNIKIGSGNLYSGTRSDFLLALQSDRNLVLYDGGSAVWASGTGISDARFKRNVRNLENSLQNICLIRGVKFNWVEDRNWGDADQIGVIAQEIETIYSELIYTDPSGHKLVDYPKFVPILIEAIKELEERLKVLEEKVET